MSPIIAAISSRLLIKNSLTVKTNINYGRRQVKAVLFKKKRRKTWEIYIFTYSLQLPINVSTLSTYMITKAALLTLSQLHVLGLSLSLPIKKLKVKENDKRWSRCILCTNFLLLVSHLWFFSRIEVKKNSVHTGAKLTVPQTTQNTFYRQESTISLKNRDSLLRNIIFFQRR